MMRRDWVEAPDEAQRLGELRAKFVKGGLPSSSGLRGDAYDYANLLARQAVRLELIALRRRMEQWTASPLTKWQEPADLLADVATVLDERISEMGAEERP